MKFINKCCLIATTLVTANPFVGATAALAQDCNTRKIEVCESKLPDGEKLTLSISVFDCGGETLAGTLIVSKKENLESSLNVQQPESLEYRNFYINNDLVEIITAKPKTDLFYLRIKELSPYAKTSGHSAETRRVELEGTWVARTNGTGRFIGFSNLDATCRKE